MIFKADVRREKEVTAMFDRMFETFGRVDICDAGTVASGDGCESPMNVEKLTTPEMFAASLLKLIAAKRMGEPEDVARAAVWLASDKSDYVYGTTISLDGGMTLCAGFIGAG